MSNNSLNLKGAIMVNFSSSKKLNEIGKFYRISNGYYTFLLNNDEKIIFEEVNKKVFSKFDLNSKELIGKQFEISYSEILDDLEDDDFIIYRIEDLKLT